MPSDLVVSVRQISNYPATTAASSGDNLLMQAGGPGAPYVSINAADLVASALQGGPAMGLGMAPPGNADGGLFTGTITVPTDGAIAWNAYLNNGDWRLLTPGQAASIGWDQVSGLDFAVSTGGSAGQELTWVSMMRLDNAGNLGLPYGTIGVARDPSANNEVVTLNYLANNTVSTFNNRNGAVQLNSQDVYNALKLCDPIATQPWVQNAINQSIQNLLYTCPFVNTWNGRKGSVYLMLSDISCVFMQPGQQPITQTPPASSNDDSIANTRWVTDLVAQFDASANLSVINVLNYGARGDGSTDDTGAIQTVLSTWAGKAIILIPDTGRSYMVRPLLLPTDTDLLLYGTLRLIAGSGSPVINVDGQSRVTIRGTGTIDGNASAVVSSAGGIAVQNSNHVRIRDVTVQNAFYWPLNVVQSTNVRVEGVSLLGGNAASEFADGCDDCWIIGCYIDGPAGDEGFSFYGGVTNSGAIGNTVTGAGADGINVLADSSQPAPCSNITIANNICHGCYGAGIGVDNGVGASGQHFRVIITGNQVYGNNLNGAAQAAGLYVDWTVSTTITGNQVSGDPTHEEDYGIWTGGNATDFVITGNSISQIGSATRPGIGLYVNSSNILLADGNAFHDYRPTGYMTAIGGSAGILNRFTNNLFGDLAAGSPVTIAPQPDTVIVNGVGGQWTLTSALGGPAYASAEMINSTATGSGQNGPGTAQVGLTIDHEKVGYSNFTAGSGEIDGIYIQMRQGGPNSDGSCILGSVTNNGEGFSSATEFSINMMQPNTWNVLGIMQNVEGSMRNVGGSFTSFGHSYTAVQGNLTTGVLVQNEPGASWTNAFQLQRDGLELFTIGGDGSITMAGHLSQGAAAGTSRNITLMTGISPRWRIEASSDAESGTNNGSNFYISAFDDGGTFLSQPLRIYRNSGLISVQNGLFVSGGGFGVGVPPIAQPTVTGSRGGNAALASLITALAAYGLVADNTTP